MAQRNKIEILITAADEASKVIEGMAKDLSKSFGNIGDSMMRTGRDIGAMTAPFAAAMGLATNQALQFDEAMTNAGSILGSTREEIDALSDDILAMGRDSRAGPQQVAESYYTIVSGVQDATTHMAILDAAIATSEAGNANLMATTDGLVAVMNAYGLEAEDASLVSDTLTRTVQKGVGTMDQFVGALGPAAGLAYDLGISFDELAGNTAFLTSTGASASESVTQLQSIMSAFLRPNERMREALEAMGHESGSAAIEALGLQGAVEELYGTLGSQDEMAQALGRQEALEGAVGLLNERYDEFFVSYTEGLEGATDSARAVQLASPAAQMDLFRSSVSALSLEIGQALVPGLVMALDTIEPFLDGLIEFVSVNPEVVQAIGLTVAGLGGLSAGLIAGGFAFKQLSNIMNMAGMVMQGVSLLMSPAMWPFLALGAAVAGLYVAFEENFLGIADVTEMVLAGDVEGGLELLGDNLEDAFGDLEDWGKDILKWGKGLGKDLEKMFTGWIEELPAMMAGFYELGTALIEWVGPAIIETIPKLAEWGASVLEWLLGEGVPMLLMGAIELAIALAEFAVEAIPIVLPALGDFIEALVRFLVEAAPVMLDAALTLAEGILNGLVTGWSKLGNFIMERLIEPIIDAVGNADWGEIAGDALGLLQDWLDLNIKIATWLYDNLIQPIIDAVLNADWGEIAGQAVDLLVKWVELIGSIGTWMKDNLIQPIIDAVVDADWAGIGDSALDLLDKFVEGIGDIATWVYDNLLKPIIDAVSSGVEDVKDAINDAIPDRAEIEVGPIEVAGREIIGRQKIGIDIPNPFAEGGAFGVQEFMLVGEQGPELMVPDRSGMVVSNDQLGTALNVLGGGAGGGGDIYIENLVVQVQQPEGADRETGREFGEGLGEGLREYLLTIRNHQGGGLTYG